MTRDGSELLRAHGLQVTAQRLAVMRAVSASPHATSEEISNAVKEEIGSISKQAVYDVLDILTEKRLLRKIQPAGSAARYEDRVGDNHHHAICRTCGKTVDVDCALGEAPCLSASGDTGFKIDEAEVIYWGTCSSCFSQ